MKSVGEKLEEVATSFEEEGRKERLNGNILNTKESCERTFLQGGRNYLLESTQPSREGRR